VFKINKKILKIFSNFCCAMAQKIMFPPASHALLLSLAITFGLTLSLARLCPAQEKKASNEYTIGAGDVLAVSFWQKPELNSDVKVNSAGEIELPVIGNMPAAGLTVSQLREKIITKISLLDITVTQATVKVTQFASKTVYVTGAVGNPGKFSFESIPNLWQVILEAGGPLPTAVLNNVTIVRGSGEEAGSILNANVSAALEQGDFSVLPPIYPGDTIHIGQRDGSSPYAIPSATGTVQNVVFVLGEVTNPGPINVDHQMDVLEVIARAGGTTESANLKQVRVLFRQRRQAELATIDIDSYLKRSVPLPLRLHEGDAVYIPRKSRLPEFLYDVGRLVVASVAGVIVLRLFQ
jgi:protein involved in polysaccharide export with SLBB domain